MVKLRATRKPSKGNTVAGTHDNCDECPDCPDLLLLRCAAADKRIAIAFYLEAARTTCMPQLFLGVAEDEMRHYVEIMREISRLDPVQAEKLRNADLGMLLMTRPMVKPKTKAAIVKEVETADAPIVLPDREDMPTVHILTKALAGEFEATNKYQRFMNEAETREVKRLFCKLMNDEKEHIAQFTAALFELTHEPLPPE
ncbi:hypothetical protein SRRS_02860 [Sporomusa rhizae]|uniref:ferritin family protein n=1 Tax=Sporomusa rhizae TaxID=357999 RepID=UPI00352B20B6